MKRRLSFIALTALGLAAASHADLYPVVLDSYGAGKRQLVSANSQFGWDFSSGTEQFYNVRALEHNWIDTISGEEYVTHCVEIYQGVTLDESYDFTGTLIADVPQTGGSWPGVMGIERAILVQDLYANYASASNGAVIDTGIDPSLDIDDYGAAFQLMLWEITHENFSATSATDIAQQITFDLGAIQANADLGVQAVLDDMFATLNDGVFDSAELEGWADPFAQDQTRLIPAPGVMVALGLALPISGRRRRRT